jgi:hypothetical protein
MVMAVKKMKWILTLKDISVWSLLTFMTTIQSHRSAVNTCSFARTPQPFSTGKQKSLAAF